MSDFGSWMQDNLLELGSLFIQSAFLIAGVWFARNLLRAIRVSQEQFGALLKLTITATSNDRPLWNESGKHPLANAGPYWLPLPDAQPANQPEPLELIESGPGWLTRAWHGMVHWLQVPMTSSGVGPWRRVLRWLQAPIRT